MGMRLFSYPLPLVLCFFHSLNCLQFLDESLNVMILNLEILIFIHELTDKILCLSLAPELHTCVYSGLVDISIRMTFIIMPFAFC